MTLGPEPEGGSFARGMLWALGITLVGAGAGLMLSAWLIQ